MDKQYKKLIEQIKIDGEKYTDNEMKSVYKFQKKQLDIINSLVGLLFLNYSNEGLLKLRSKEKKNIDLTVFLKKIAKDSSQNEIKEVSKILSNIYSDSYYKNAFILDSGLQIDLKFNILKKEFIEAAINKKYKGELFSDRIWNNKINMIDKLKKSIEECMNGKTTIDKIGKDIKNTFNVQAYESQRLVRTEMARVQTQAGLDIAESTGVKQVMWSATLDALTNPEDANLDGKIWDIDDDYPTPPLHPNCRCALINVPFEGWSPTVRKDNETKDIIDYVKYDEWLKNKGVD
jgi:SPP1 gp7 family putative phage head morphogenesis protein